MKYDLNVPIKTLDGKEFAPNGKATTVKDICQQALENYVLTGPDGKNVPGESFKNFRLAQKLHDSKESIKLEAEDVTRIKKLVETYYKPFIVGAVFNVLEKEDKDSKNT